MLPQQPVWKSDWIWLSDLEFRQESTKVHQFTRVGGLQQTENTLRLVSCQNGYQEKR